mmetsp:Transcript_45277/g.135347  ORF Transcript_45277/g.135347 Transcript_45277/m.135347 type:complete len:208 (+) Transcript_45277:702-1325(+)
MEVAARLPAVCVGVVDLATAQGLHEGLPRRGACSQRATPHSVHLAAKQRAAVSPAGVFQRCHVGGPGLSSGIEDLAARKEALDDAVVVIASNYDEPVVWKGSGSTARTPQGHARARDPPSVPCVEHLDGVQRTLLLVAAAQHVQLVGQRLVEVQEGRDDVGVQRRGQGVLPPRVPLVVIDGEPNERVCDAWLGPVGPAHSHLGGHLS